jgi:hypothetical protein
MMGRSEKLNSSKIVLSTLCLQVHNAAAPFTSPSNSPMMLIQNHFPGAKPAYFDFIDEPQLS